MKHYCLKYIEVKLQGQREAYLPEIMDVKGREVTAIIPTHNKIIGGGSEADLQTVFLNVVDVVGQRKIVDNMPLSLIADDMEQGVFLPICRKIDLRNCYIYNPSLSNDVVALVISYINEDIISSAFRREEYTAVDIVYSQGVEAHFDETERLRDVVFTGVEWGTNKRTLLNQEIDQTRINDLFLTLQKGQMKIFDRVPLTLLKQDKYYSKMDFFPITLDLDNSYLESFGQNSGVCTLIFKYSRK